MDGERRWRAHELIGRVQIPMLVQELSDIEAREKALDANIQDESFTDFEEAQALKGLWIAYEEEPGIIMSFREMARRRNKSVSFVSNRMNLVGYGGRLGYAPDVQEMASRHRGVLSSAALINPLPIDRRQKYIALVDKGASYKAVESAIEADNTQLAITRASSQAPDAQTQSRTNAQSRGESSGMSRGLRLTGTKRREALSQAQRHMAGLADWIPEMSEADFEKHVIPFARKIMRAELSPKETKQRG